MVQSIVIGLATRQIWNFLVNSNLNKKIDWKNSFWAILEEWQEGISKFEANYFCYGK